MDCIKVSQNLHHYLDGEVGRWRRTAIARHLETCAACSSGFAFESHVRQIVTAKAVDDPPAHLEGRILDALSRQPLHGDDFAPPASPFGS